ncbi:MAG TPA: glucose-6-phosphate dehydrogenase [Bryobacteraceae bacterium]|nr:glucose-6-phosphate dehydrogenase [Bryobacteraceae bacterium]
MSGLKSDALVFLGATGDLAYKKIFPALQAMVMRGHLNVPVIGVAKAGWNLEQFRARAQDSVTKHGGLDPAAFNQLSGLLRYIDGDYQDPATWNALCRELNGAQRPAYYLAIPPVLFETVVEQLAASGCARDARVILEKPFGRDLASARELNAILHARFDESAIFRIDHYLGKRPVNNMVVFRFANTFVESFWNRHHIESVQITMAEDFGVQGRGAFYEQTGTVRDVVQNHLFQILSIVAMEPPVRTDSESLRDEKVKVLKAIPSIAEPDLVRGQFRGYRDENGVAKDSKVETFAALRLEINSWRWTGVPFYIRAGKRLPVTCTEVVGRFRKPPTVIPDHVLTENHLRLRINPDVTIAMGITIMAPREELAGQAAEMVASRYPGAGEMDAYERVLGAAMEGDATLFARQDYVEEAWRIVDPALAMSTPVYSYEPNTWGPNEVANVTPPGGWHDPAVDQETLADHRAA